MQEKSFASKKKKTQKTLIHSANNTLEEHEYDQPIPLYKCDSRDNRDKNKEE